MKTIKKFLAMIVMLLTTTVFIVAYFPFAVCAGVIMLVDWAENELDDTAPVREKYEP